MTLLEVQDLAVEFAPQDRTNRIRIARVLNGVSFTVGPGEVLGLVGESGSGKSMTVKTAMGLLPNGANVVGGRVRFGGREMLGLGEAAWRKIRGRDIAMITQSPLAGLDPLTRIGDQLIRVQREHGTRSRKDAALAARAALARVGIPDPDRRLRAWPHELSGGTAQRVVIAMSMLNDASLIIADEPTTGLDATVQIQVLDELRRAVTGRNLGAILVTHDMGVVAHYCDRVAVMFAGMIVEQGPVRDLFAHPSHPYTRALIEAARGGASPTAQPPNLFALSTGCLYSDRCERGNEQCSTRPAVQRIRDHHDVACHYAA